MTTYFAVLLILFTCGAAPAWDGVCVRVVDGDSIVVRRGEELVRVRLYGIDCPERGQPYGPEATRFTRALVRDRCVEVIPVTRDRWGRTVAWVIVNHGDREVSVNHALLAAGLAWWFRKYARHADDLALLEYGARTTRRGLWAEGDAAPPWRWRRARSN